MSRRSVPAWTGPTLAAMHEAGHAVAVVRWLGPNVIDRASVSRRPAHEGYAFCEGETVYRTKGRLSVTTALRLDMAGIAAERLHAPRWPRGGAEKAFARHAADDGGAWASDLKIAWENAARAFPDRGPFWERDGLLKICRAYDETRSFFRTVEPVLVDVATALDNEGELAGERLTEIIGDRVRTSHVAPYRHATRDEVFA